MQFEADGALHRTRTLNAYDAFHLYRLVSPVLPAASALDLMSGDVDDAVVAQALRDVTPEALRAAFAAAAGAAERQDGEAWIPATKAIPLPDMVVMMLAVVEANLAGFLDRTAPNFKPTRLPRPMWQAADMPDGESWLFRPCETEPPLIDMLALFDGRATLFHVAKANDLLNVRAENEARAMAAAEKKR